MSDNLIKAALKEGLLKVAQELEEPMEEPVEEVVPEQEEAVASKKEADYMEWCDLFGKILFYKGDVASDVAERISETLCDVLMSAGANLSSIPVPFEWKEKYAAKEGDKMKKKADIQDAMESALGNSIMGYQLEDSRLGPGNDAIVLVKALENEDYNRIISICVAYAVKSYVIGTGFGDREYIQPMDMSDVGRGIGDIIGICRAYYLDNDTEDYEDAVNQAWSTAGNIIENLASEILEKSNQVINEMNSMMTLASKKRGSKMKKQEGMEDWVKIEDERYSPLNLDVWALADNPHYSPLQIWQNEDGTFGGWDDTGAAAAAGLTIHPLDGELKDKYSSFAEVNNLFVELGLLTASKKTHPFIASIREEAAKVRKMAERLPDINSWEYDEERCSDGFIYQYWIETDTGYYQIDLDETLDRYALVYNDDYNGENQIFVPSQGRSTMQICDELYQIAQDLAYKCASKKEASEGWSEYIDDSTGCSGYTKAFSTGGRSTYVIVEPVDKFNGDIVWKIRNAFVDGEFETPEDAMYEVELYMMNSIVDYNDSYLAASKKTHSLIASIKKEAEKIRSHQ